MGCCRVSGLSKHLSADTATMVQSSASRLAGHERGRACRGHLLPCVRERGRGGTEQVLSQDRDHSLHGRGSVRLLALPHSGAGPVVPPAALVGGVVPAAQVRRVLQVPPQHHAILLGGIL